MISSERVYDFVFKGLLTQESLDKAGRRTLKTSDFEDQKIVSSLSVDLLDDQLVSQAKPMAIVYVSIAAFENSVRDLISGVLLENNGEV